MTARRDLHPLNAVIYLPYGLVAASTWRDAAAEYCQRRRYNITSVICGWEDLVHTMLEGKADVAVVGRRDHLPRDRRPRLDVLVEQGPTDDPSLRRVVRLR